MPAISRPDAKRIVREALKLVADFTGDFEAFTFRSFKGYHKTVFLDSIKLGLNAQRISARRYLDIELSDEVFAEWPTLGACVDWVVDNTGIAVSRSDTTTLPQADLEA